MGAPIPVQNLEFKLGQTELQLQEALPLYNPLTPSPFTIFLKQSQVPA